MNINELIRQIHQNAVDHGWWKEKRGAAEAIVLMHCELSEAIEELRKGNPADYVYENEEKPGKAEGVPVELADCVIRIFDFLGSLGKDFDFESILMQKHEYNKSRPYKHGKTF